MPMMRCGFVPARMPRILASRMALTTALENRRLAFIKTSTDYAEFIDKFWKSWWLLFCDHQATAYRPRRGSAPPEITPDFTSYSITVGDEPVPQSVWIFNLCPRALSCLITSGEMRDSILSTPARNSWLSNELT